MFHFILSGFREKKIYIISFILFLLGYFFLLVLFSIYNHYDYEINSLKEEEVNRGVDVYTNDIHTLDSYNDIIEKYYPVYTSKQIEKDHQYYDFNTWNDDFKITLGSEPKNKYDVVVSERLYRNFHLSEDDYHRTINYSINGVNYQFHIVGITNHNQVDIYMNMNDFISLFQSFPNQYFVLINHYQSVQPFIEKLMKSGIVAEIHDSTIQMQIDSIKNLKRIYFIILCFIMILLFLFLWIIVKNNIQHENKNIAIYKAIGYRINQINFIITMRLLLVALFSYFFIQICMIIVSFIYHNTLILYGLGLLKLIQYNTYILFVIICFIILNIYFYRRKIIKMNVMDVLQDF